MSKTSISPTDHSVLTIYVGEETFLCHRSILENSSSYFKAMFNGNFSESNSNRITLQGVDPSAFDEVLKGIYKGKMKITPQNAYCILKTCSFLSLPELEKYCVSFIEKNLPVDDLLEVCFYANLLKDESLFNAIINYIAEHFVEMVKIYDLSNWPLSILEAILSQENLNKNDDCVLLTIAKWAENDSDNSVEAVEKLLSAAKLTNVNFSALVKLISKMNCSNSDTNESEESCEKGTLKVTCGIGVPTLKVYLKATYEESRFNTMISLAYTPTKTDKWKLADNFKMSFRTLKTVVVDKRQYFLSYDSNQHIQICQFWMVENGKRTCLREPPLIAKNYQIAACENFICLYFPEQNVIAIDSVSISSPAFPDCLYFYRIDRDRWYTTSKLIQVVEGASLVVKDDVVYLIGGKCGPEFQKLFNQCIQRYSFRSKNWDAAYFNYVNGNQCTINFCFGAACTYLGCIYISGSEDGKTPSDAFRLLDIRNYEYANLGIYDNPRMKRGKHHVLIPYDDELYAIDNEPLSNMEKYTISKTSFGKWNQEPSLPEKISDNRDNCVMLTGDLTAAVVVHDYYS